MTEEEKKIRYRNIVYRLNIINNKIINLNGSINTLRTKIKNSISINDKGLEEESLVYVNNNLSSSSSSIRGYIIPSINNKIY